MREAVKNILKSYSNSEFMNTPIQVQCQFCQSIDNVDAITVGDMDYLMCPSCRRHYNSASTKARAWMKGEN